MARIKRNGAGTKQTGVWTESHGFITEKGWKFLVHKHPAWALKAVVELFDRQTQDEKETRSTHWDNERGFRCDDASRGAKLAKRIVQGVKREGGYQKLAQSMDRYDDDLQLALFLAKRYRKQCLNIVARAQAARKGA